MGVITRAYGADCTGSVVGGCLGGDWRAACNDGTPCATWRQTIYDSVTPCPLHQQQELQILQIYAPNCRPCCQPIQHSSTISRQK